MVVIETSGDDSGHEKQAGHQEVGHSLIASEVREGPRQVWADKTADAAEAVDQCHCGCGCHTCDDLWNDSEDGRGDPRESKGCDGQHGDQGIGVVHEGSADGTERADGS